MPDSIKGIYRLFLKKIKIDKVLYVPRTDPEEITEELVTSLWSRESEDGSKRKEIILRESDLTESPRYMSVLNMNKPHYQEVLVTD